jgi:hypothetical protein
VFTAWSALPGTPWVGAVVERKVKERLEENDGGGEGRTGDQHKPPD